MDPNQEQPTPLAAPEYVPAIEVQQPLQPLSPQQQVEDSQQQAPLNVGPSRAAGLATMLLMVSASLVAIPILSFLLSSIGDGDGFGSIVMFLAPLIVIAAISLFVVYAIVRKSYIAIGMIGLSVIIYIAAFTSTSYDFVSFMASVFPFVLGPLLAAAVIMLLVDAFKLVSQQPSTIRSKNMRVGLLVAAIIGSLISVGGTVFILAMYLSVRACELSGSSKCM